MGKYPKWASSSLKFIILLYSNIWLSSIDVSNKDLEVPALLVDIEAAVAWLLLMLSKPWLRFPSKPRNPPGSHDTAHAL